jgi:ABC-type nitrate/sulfonate/bicarbonate transport system permease component
MSEPESAIGRARTIQAGLMVVGASVWILTWWGIAVAFEVSPDFLPTPWQVAEKLIWLTTHGIGEGTLWVHAGWSLLRFLSGFLMAVVVGIPLGLLMGHVRWIGNLFNPLFELFRNVPPIAWAPFALLWFGASFGSQTFVIFTAALPPMLMNAYQGIRLVEPGLINAARMLGAGPATLLFRIGLPAALPLVIAGLRIGLANGWLALVGAEIIAGPGALTGLGFLILVGQENLQATLTIGAMAVIGLIGAALDYGVRRLERRVARCR